MAFEQNIRDTLLFKTLQKRLQNGKIKKQDSILAVCASIFEQQVFDALGLNNYTITSLFDDSKNQIKNYQKENALQLSFPNQSYNHVIAHAGLHHCSSPHQALCEMYRVARQSVLFFEAQDSLTMRILNRLKISADYETDAVADSNYLSGGVDNKPIPNYVYRWTTREVEKVCCSYDPAQTPDLEFERNFFFYPGHLDGYLEKHFLTRIFGKKLMKKLANGAVWFLNVFLSGQGNSFVAVINKK